MGQIFVVKCNNCNYRKEFRLGSGIKDSSVDNICSNFTEDYEDRIRNLFINSGESLLYFERCLGTCKECENIDQFGSVIEIDKGRKRFLLSERCKCGHEYNKKFSEQDIEEGADIDCPVCKNRLDISIGGLWD